jgi:hypothetical protein
MDETQATAHETEIPFSDLPTWMRQSRQGIDWGILVVIFFSLLAAWPFLLQPGLPRTNATENHVFLAADYATSMREGRLYPRWSAAAFSGYGAPIPHYTPPGSAYTTALGELLFTGDTVLAVRLMYMLAIVLAGSMTYVFVTRWGGARAGILASVLYVYSPYIGLAAPHILGDLPGVMGFALLPALMWSVHRLLFSNRSFDFALVILATWGLLLTVPKVAFVGAILVVMLLIWYVLTQLNKRRALLVLVAGIMGIMMASFYWLPALIEWDAVQWQVSPIMASPHKLAFPEIISTFHRIDLSELVVTPQFTVGIVTLIFTALSVVTLTFERKNRGLYGLILANGAGILIIGVLVLPEETWLLGPAIWCLAVGGGATMQLSQRVPVRWRRLMLPATLILVLLASMPVLSPPRWPETFGGASLGDQILYEQQGFGIAVLPAGTDIPVTMSDPIVPNRDLMDGYQRNEVMRIAQNRLSYDNQIALVTDETHRDRYLVTTTNPLVFDVLRAGFPGWQATLDGEGVDLRVSDTSGLIRIAVPAHTGQLTISLGSTPVRQIAWALSWGTFFSLLTIVWIRSRRYSHIYTESVPNFITVQEMRLLAIVLGGLFVIVLLFATPDSPYSLHARPGYGLDGTIELRARTNVGLEALSYQIERTDYHIGESLEFFVAWRTSRPLLRNYEVRVFLQDTLQELRWLQGESNDPGYYPTHRWRTNAYVRDEHRLLLSSALRPGEYRVAIEVIYCDPVCSSDDRLTFFDSQGQLIGQTLILPTLITIEP